MQTSGATDNVIKNHNANVVEGQIKPGGNFTTNTIVMEGQVQCETNCNDDMFLLIIMNHNSGS